MAKKAPWMPEADAVAKERAAKAKAEQKARGSRVYAVLPWRGDARYHGSDVLKWYRLEGAAENFALGIEGGRGLVVRRWDQINDPDVQMKHEVASSPKSNAQIKREINEAMTGKVAAPRYGR